MDSGNPDNPQVPRSALGDIANQLGKRGFSLVSRSPASKSSDKNVPKSAGKDEGCAVVKRISLGKENIPPENYESVNTRAGTEVGLCPLKGGKAYRLQSYANVDLPQHIPSLGLSSKLPEAKKQQSGEDEGRRDDIVQTAIAVGDNLRENSCSSLTAGETEEKKRRDVSETAQANSSNEGVVSETAGSDGKNLGSSSMSYSISASVVGPRLTEFPPLKSFELARCSGIKGGDGCPSSSELFESLKGCPCSLCMKAAFIWSDLHYQDIKGRVSALKKSQKEANNSAQNFCVGNQIGRQGEGNLSNSSKLEADLMNQWKSLFVGMGEMLAEERAQLETSYQGLKDMREICKRNLVTACGETSGVQPCSSEASADKII